MTLTRKLWLAVIFGILGGLVLGGTVVALDYFYPIPPMSDWTGR